MAAQAIAQPVVLRSVSLSVGQVGFTYTGDVPGGLRYDYEGAALAIVYLQPHLAATGILGLGSPTLLDAALSGLVPLRILSMPQRGLQLPVVIGFGHRRVLLSGAERWDATRFGLGIAVLWAPPQTALTVRASPVLSLVTSSLATGYGVSPGAEVDAAIVVAEIGSGRHVVVGYNFRYQAWNINPPRHVTGDVDRYFDYRSLMHFVRAGLRF